MHRVIWLRFAAGVLVLMAATAAQAQIGTYLFNSNNQGWQQAWIGYNSGSIETLYPNAPADWTGFYGVGFPDGSIYQTSNGSSWEKRPYYLGVIGTTPAASLGDLTGQTLQVYIRSTANWRGRVDTDKVYARWVIARDNGNGTYNQWVSKAAYSIDLNAPEFGTGTDADWVLKSIPLVEANFFKWPNQSDITGTFSAVLTNYNSFGLAILPTAAGNDDLSNWNGQPGTWGAGWTLLHFGATAKDNTGNATWGVDGFGVQPIPEPAFFQMGALAALSGLGLLRARRRNG
jgi:hypothetical protein